MTISKKYYINTGKDGVLADTSESDVSALLQELQNSQKIVLHFHGGLVNKKAGLETAKDLLPIYQEAGAHPVFFVWESGLIDTISHNFGEISKEPIFKKLLGKILQHVAGKLLTEPTKSATGQSDLPSNIEVAVELQKADVGNEPYADINIVDDLSNITNIQEEALVKDLQHDTTFIEEVEAIASGSHPEQKQDNAKGISTLRKKSTKTLISPELIDELVEDRTKAEKEGAKGILTTAKWLYRAAKIIYRVVKRIKEGRGHGAYTTVVEEILRDFYLANVGATIWHAMKKETADTFENVGGSPARGGWFFMERLSDLIQNGYDPKITLVGHSTGAVFICHFLDHIRLLKEQGKLPGQFAVSNVVFLAPAVDFDLFYNTVKNNSELIGKFRMLTMTDENESRDKLFAPLYLRSLLYFVSGVVERDPSGEGTFDEPIVGMERYYADSDTYNIPSVNAIRKYIKDEDSRAVWSITNDGPGRASNATSHGSFDDAGPGLTTMKSVRHIIMNE